MTATVRNVRVVMEADVASYIAKVKFAGRETKNAFDSANTSTGRAEKSMQALSKAEQAVARDAGRMAVGMRTADRDVDRLGRTVQQSTRQLDTMSGRVGLLGQALLLLGPAAAPIGAVAVPALVGLGTQLGVTVAAAGAAVIAFQGVGDALKALDKARLEPTADNIRAAEEAMDELAPAARRLVTHLDNLREEWKQTRDITAQGLFPGVDKGITLLEQRIPAVQRLLGTLAEESGDLFRRGAADIASSRWDDFFNYLQREGRPILDDTAGAVGHVAHALGELFAATAPMQRGFTGFLRDEAEDFDQWASRVSQTKGFRDFLNYAAEEGPKVAAATGAIANAIVQVVEAAAPLGGPVLEGIEGVADALATIADSDIGTPLITGAAAFVLLSNARKGWDRVNQTDLFSRNVVSPLKELPRTLPTLQQAGTYVYRFGQSSKYASEQTMAARKAVGDFGRSLALLGKSAALMGGVAIVASGLADKMGYTNTATFALTGAMIGGGAGAVAGGLAGALLDTTKQMYDADAATRAWRTSLTSGQTDVKVFADQLAAVQGQVEKLANGLPDGLLDKKILSPQYLQMSFEALFGDLDNSALGKAQDQAVALQSQYDDLVTAINVVGRTLGDIPVGQSITDFAGLSTILNEASPAMAALGYTTEDLIKGIQTGAIIDIARQIGDWTTATDSAAGRQNNLAAAVRGLDDRLLSTKQSANQLAAALDSLLSPSIDLQRATDAYTTGLRHLKDNLAASGRGLTGNGDAAIKNREAIAGLVDQMTAQLSAQAAAGASSKQLANSLERQRDRLIKAADAAGLNKDQVKALIKQYGLTPRLVKTLIEANTKPAEQGISNVNRQLADLDGKTATVTSYFKTIYVTQGKPGAKAAPTDPTLGGLVKPHKRARGGAVRGPGTSTSDSIPALLSDGEYVMKAASVDKYGVKMMEAINAGKFARGGYVSHSDAEVLKYASGGAVRTLRRPRVPASLQELIDR